MRADEYLLRAAALLAQRAEDYDKPQGERSIPGAVRAFNAITGRDLTNDEGWLLLVCLKLHRQYQVVGNHLDSIEDAGAYWALWAESLDAVEPALMADAITRVEKLNSPSIPELQEHEKNTLQVSYPNNAEGRQVSRAAAEIHAGTISRVGGVPPTKPEAWTPRAVPTVPEE